MILYIKNIYFDMWKEFSVKGSVLLDGSYQFSNLVPIDQVVTDNCQ